MKTLLLIVLIGGVLFVLGAGVVFFMLLRWFNLVLGSWSGPWFRNGSVSVIDVTASRGPSPQLLRRSEGKPFWCRLSERKEEKVLTKLTKRYKS